MYAAIMGHSAVVTLLLDRGAAIEAGDGVRLWARRGALHRTASTWRLMIRSPFSCAQTGATALARAAAVGNMSMVTLLLGRGADINAACGVRTHPLLRLVLSACG
jgi:hypothetical protein